MWKIMSLLVLLMFCGSAYAEQSAVPTIANARALLEQGQDAEGIGLLQQVVKTSPEHYQAWFLLGVTQAKQRRFHDAITSFGKVVSLQPKLAEPHNNLAVIYNELGDFRAAVKELEASLKLKPDYVTAHENIGDLYVKLAADAYRKALAKESRPALRQRYERLLHIRDIPKSVALADEQPAQSLKHAADAAPETEIEIGTETATTTEPVATPAVQAADAQQKPEKQPIAALTPAKPSSEPVVAEDQPRQDSVEQTEANGGRDNKPEAQSIATIQPHQPLPQTTAQTAVAPSPVVETKSAETARKAALAAVEIWRAAWNKRDLPAYFAAYSPEFEFSKRFETREQWKHYKQWVIKKRAFIQVTLENIEAKVLPDGEIKLVFLQHFRSDSYNSDDIKEMLLRQTQDGWKITYEASK